MNNHDHGILPERLFRKVRVDYRRRYGGEIEVLDSAGRLQTSATRSALLNKPLARRSRAYALAESVRWGEACIFFVAPGILSWVVPLVNGERVRGGLAGGEFLSDADPSTRETAVRHFQSLGGGAAESAQLVDPLPVAGFRGSERSAADDVYNVFYAMSGWDDSRLRRNRANALQQRQIAEEIHSRKLSGRESKFALDDERMLLSLIRVGDRNGARRMLNRALGAMFLHAPRIVVLKARVMEMMGFLVRSAVEDSPMLDSLVEKHQQWGETIVEADSFEALCIAVRDALDAFVDGIHLQGFNRTDTRVRAALVYIKKHYNEPLTLKQVADHIGLSHYRLAHLLKENTGRTMVEQVRRLRIEQACRFLDDTQMRCSEIAQEVGYADQSYFTRNFVRMMGVTPARYRRGGS